MLHVELDKLMYHCSSLGHAHVSCQIERVIYFFYDDSHMLHIKFGGDN